MKKVKLVEEFDLSSTDIGKIVVSELINPYGEGTEPVISIAVDLEDNKEIDYKVHIPFDDLDNLISALQKAKEFRD
jgi:hypothetical protein